MNRVKWASLGLLSGLAGFYIFSLLQAVFRPAWIAHAVAIGLVLMSAAILLVLRRAEPSRRAQSGALNPSIAGFAIAFSLGIVVCIASLSSVAERAKDVARGAPFCVQVADNGGAGYKPAETLLDLSGLTLWSLSSVRHHAILVVGDGAGLRYFHWSYRKQDFEVGVIDEKVGEYEPAVTCIPRRDFIDGLPVLFPQASTSRYVRFSRQEAFRIPDAYQPHWSGGQGRTLFLATTAPEFAPLNTSWDNLPTSERDSNWVFVEWKPPWFLSLMSSTDGRVVEQGTEFGLQKTLIVWRGRDSKDYESHRYIANAAGQSNNVNTTLIQCYPASGQFPESCQHRFLSGGRHYYFRHRPEEVPRWQEMQKKLLDLFASFEVHAMDMQSSH